MAGVRRRGEKIRSFILSQVAQHPDDIAAVAAQEFEISRQAVNRHLKRLIDQGSLLAEGTTRSRSYKLCPQIDWKEFYALSKQPLLEEDLVWSRDVRPQLGELPDNVLDIWFYGFTEILNNAIDHSSGSSVCVNVTRDAQSTEISILDDGEGIFRKIRRELDLLDERHAVLELSKGKLTTDPENHSGQGIFFSSRMFDQFAILSGGVYFSHEYEKIEDWIIERHSQRSGTFVHMQLSNNTARTSKAVFDQFSSSLEQGYGFIKTIVPVRLAQYGDERLVSRSQAKRLLARVDKFEVIIFDFEGVEAIGQAFADQVFRVFCNQFPGKELAAINANTAVEQMIRRASAEVSIGEEP